MTHFVLMKAVGIQLKHAEMYTQMYHFVRIVAIFSVLYTSLYLYMSDTASCYLKPLSCLFD